MIGKVVEIDEEKKDIFCTIQSDEPLDFIKIYTTNVESTECERKKGKFNI